MADEVAKVAAFASLTEDELTERLVAAGYRPFVARQVMHGVYRHSARSFDEITTLPKELRAWLRQHYTLRQLAVEQISRTADDSFKLGLRLTDGNVIETAYLSDSSGVGESSGDTGGSGGGSVCVSSQVGCAVSCLFCASGVKGLTRNLTSAEMVEQVLAARDHLPAGRRLTHVTYMGIGEPLANVDALLRSIRIINAPWGLNIAARRISVSSCGLISGMQKLAASGLQIHLAISLHAPDDELRRRLMPNAPRASIREIIDAAREYAARTTRKITIEYVLLGGVNDSPDQARALAALVRGFPNMVNLIPYNRAAACPAELRAPSTQRVKNFLQTLRSHGVECCLRRRRGAEVDAACGQMRVRLEAADNGPCSAES